ncbi:MAG: hypothetical protein LBC87_05915 [Fibromonadaceae bacterium]|jgi:hypothetical protein|nr:hypothetical protein [Fibromonadaceae bacterium]
MKYKCLCAFFAGLLIFACNNSDPSNGNLESSSSLNGYSSPNEYSSSSISGPTPGVSSSSDISEPNPDISSSSNILGSSSGVLTSSSSDLSSSSEVPPEIINWPTLKKGDPGVKEGWGSRYWDGCKPHCSLRDNVDINANPFTICRNCNKNNKEIPTFTLSPNIEVRYDEWAKEIKEDWVGYEETKSSCQNGIAYACWDMAPYALDDNLAYAFMATALKNASCGQCFQLQFDGGAKYGEKQAHGLLKGKTLIVMATNTGSDVEDGQFDIMIPGGGPGMFDSFAEQIGVSKDQLGEGYGGFLTTCQQELHDYDKPAKEFQECVRNKCNAVFSKKSEHKDLLRGCLWFADWYMAADNPTYLYKKVDCPKYFTDKYLSTINKSPDNKIEPYGGFKKTIPAGYETQKWIW